MVDPVERFQFLSYLYILHLFLCSRNTAPAATWCVRDYVNLPQKLRYGGEKNTQQNQKFWYKPKSKIVSETDKDLKHPEFCLKWLNFKRQWSLHGKKRYIKTYSRENASFW